MSKRKTVIAVLVVGAALALVGFMAAKPKLQSLPQQGYLAPDFTLTDMQGKTVTLSQLKGHPVYINFFASWCPPCKLETPDLETMYKKYGNRIDFLAVNMTPSDSLAGVKSYIQTFGVTYPVFLDSSGTVESTYNVMDIPTSFFINPQGVIIARITGMMTPSFMQSEFSKLSTLH
ncbi:TlpA disulfide reductase family protein [Sulfoacidibacillus thermotolerans]|uniref:Thioredoxin domain-containing protein n=1 Tax=Sulfoacidibacillus thermotolerans TaxID=1765684 RepID=A0A2U3D6N6_SULT2|nr:TlpA disulfide reductase family protein [Sulfoacidibacillus thermotolerans]PWI56945.1 hypothetical protein BM613_11100 [Sulfoacidibacillus thermotolerans]